MQTISDYSEEIEEINRLRRRDYREETGLTIVEGYTEVSRMAKAKMPVKALYICPEIFKDSLDEFRGLRIVEISAEVFGKMAFGEKLKGIIAVCQPRTFTLDEIRLSQNPLVVIMGNVVKPGDLGAAVRTSDGAGADCVIMCDGKTDVYNHNIVRSSMSTVFHLPTVAADKDQALSFLRRNHIKIYTATSSGEKIYTQCDFRKPTAFIFGNDKDCISPFWLENSDEHIKIPIMGEQEGLNTASCVSILAYEALRQRA